MIIFDYILTNPHEKILFYNLSRPRRAGPSILHFFSMIVFRIYNKFEFIHSSDILADRMIYSTE